MISSSVTKATFCAEQTRNSNEPLYATATAVKVWFLLQYQQPWSSKATADNNLPLPVKEFLSGQIAAIAQSRLLFIKQDQDQQQELHFFVVKTSESAPVILEYKLHTYEDLLALDLTSLIAEQETNPQAVRRDPLFLVCSNGKRDKCCAKYGRPVFAALQRSQGNAVWQSSHIGGHRYAPNLLFLPHSVNFGLFTPEEAQSAASAYLDGQIYDLDRYRGRTYYAPHVQAADYFLRRALHYHALTGIHLLADENVAENTWIVQFLIGAKKEIHQLQIQRHMTPHNYLVSCSSPKEKAVPRYQLLKHSTRS